MPLSDPENDADRKQLFLIWDTEGSPPVGDWTTILWSSFEDSGDPFTVSIPHRVEERADALRTAYLAWVYEIGETRIKEKKIVDHLDLRPGFSYWWMTSIAQKFNIAGKSQINNVIKMIAFEKIISERIPRAIELVSSNEKLAVTLKRYCRRLGMRFSWNIIKPAKKSRLVARVIYGHLPSPVQAIIYLTWYLLKAVPLLCKKQRTETPAFHGEISFIDILVHLDKKAFTEGKFISNYWTKLVDALCQENIKTNWLHNYFRHEQIPTLSCAQELIRRFNEDPENNQPHALIESSLSLSVFKKAIKDYLIICRMYRRLCGNSSLFRPAGSSLDLLPLFKDELNESLCGQEAIINCLRISLYEKIFNNITRQKLGIYIQENQPWEMALMYAWKSAGHGRLIGVPHSVVRYWDLRYFYDPRSYERDGRNPLPLPDGVAVNGPPAKKTYLDGGYPESHIIEVEALRYLHLLQQNKKNAGGDLSAKHLTVLVCGDFDADTNHKIVSWISSAAQSLPAETTFVLKPHPAYTMNLGTLTSPTFKVTTAPLDGLFKDCDAVFTSNITSSAVNAYYSGIPVIQMLDGNAFNMSPLRDIGGVVYVKNSSELADALQNSRQRIRLREHYFHLDNELPRWKNLIEHAVTHG